MAANLSKVAVMGSCVNGHVVQNDSAMSEPITHLRKQSKIGYKTMGNVVIEGNS